jgi:nitrogen fixation NifU-like protein
MSELSDLYQELILDHGRKPRNFRAVAGANRRAEGFNPLCGDRLTLELVIEDGVVKDAGFQGAGCAISTAAASTMIESIKGKSVASAEALFDQFHGLVTGKAVSLADLPPKLGAFMGVSAYPMRVKCATLAWHTLKNALAGRPEAASTE